MKRKPLKIDWDELESAFNNTNEELVYYLDLVTGQVTLEGEGDEFDDDDDMSEEMPPVETASRSDTTRLYIEPPDPDEETGWMKEFVRETEGLDPEIAERLRRVLSEEDAFSAFRAILRGQDETRDHWFLYRSGRMHEAMEAWLDANEVRATDPPPWRTQN